MTSEKPNQKLETGNLKLETGNSKLGTHTHLPAYCLSPSAFCHLTFAFCHLPFDFCFLVSAFCFLLERAKALLANLLQEALERLALGHGITRRVPQSVVRFRQAVKIRKDISPRVLEAWPGPDHALRNAPGYPVAKSEALQRLLEEVRE